MSFHYTQSSNEETILHQFLKISQKVRNFSQFFFLQFSKRGKNSRSSISEEKGIRKYSNTKFMQN